MKKFKFLPIFLALCLLVPLLTALPARAEAPVIGSHAAILVDRSSGSVLFSQNETEPLYPASLTKIMTSLVAIEAIEAGTAGRGDRVTVTDEALAAVGEDASLTGLRVGEVLTLEDLLYCALLSSGNDACNVIALHLSGSISAYAERMTLRAAQLGCTDTNFVNVHGATEYLHKTTALDLARIALAASRNALFMEICGTAEHTVTTEGGRVYHLTNSNALLSSAGESGDAWLYEGASGMKTGYTNAAGSCLVATAERDGRELLAVILHGYSSDGRYRDAHALFDYGFSALGSGAAPSVSLLSGDFETGGPGPSLTSLSAVVMDRKTGDVLYSKRAESPIYPADTAKLMTALLAIEAVEQGEVALRAEVTISASASDGLGLDAVRMLGEGETLTLESLLCCTLVGSADDAANAIAEFIAGDREQFVTQMNEEAQRLGCTDTHFTNPSGLFANDNTSTAADMARIGLEVTRHELLTRICSMATAEIPETNLSGARQLKTSNALLVRDGVYGSGYVYDRATGLKSGQNAAAGYCLLATAADEESGIELLVSVYGGERDENGYSSFRDAIALFNWIFENYSYQEVLNPNRSVASVDVNLGMDTDYVNLKPASAVTLLLPNEYDPSMFSLDMTVYSLQQGKIVTAPVTAGEVLGEVSVIRAGVNCGTVKLVAAANVDLSRSRYITSHVRETIHSSTFRMIVSILVVIVVLYLGWVVYYRIRRLRYKRAVKRSRGSNAPKGKARPAPAGAERPQEPKIEFFGEGRGAPAVSAPEAVPLPAGAAEPESIDDVLASAPALLGGNAVENPTDAQSSGPEEPPVPAPEPLIVPPAESVKEHDALPAVPVVEPIPPEKEAAFQIPTFEDLPADFTGPTPSQPEAPAAPAAPSAPEADSPAADDPFDLFRTKAERDYFEEFFRKK